MIPLYLIFDSSNRLLGFYFGPHAFLLHATLTIIFSNSIHLPKTRSLSCGEDVLSRVSTPSPFSSPRNGVILDRPAPSGATEGGKKYCRKHPRRHSTCGERPAQGSGSLRRESGGVSIHPLRLFAGFLGASLHDPRVRAAKSMLGGGRAASRPLLP